jgi:hypothetical protein
LKRTNNGTSYRREDEILPTLILNAGFGQYSVITPHLGGHFESSTEFRVTRAKFAVSITGPASVCEYALVDTTSSSPSTVRDLGMSNLETAASTHDDELFVSTIREINWNVRSVKEHIRAIQLALETGAHSAARRLAIEGARRYPLDAQLLKYARLLAPPEVRLKPAAPERGPRANRNWLKANADQYRGKWIALKCGQLLAVADSLEELKGMLGDTRGVLVTIA